MASAKRQKRNNDAKSKLVGFKIGSERFEVNHYIYVRSVEKNKPNYIGRIIDIEEEQDTVMLTLAWCYRPEEIKGGRRDFHGDREVFPSNHMDKCTVDCVDGRCHVLAMKDYLKLSTIPADLYYHRAFYDWKKHTFAPPVKEWEAYCSCKKPYNPDQTYIGCDGTCGNWFHPPCIGLSTSELKKVDKFLCSTCEKKRRLMSIGELMNVPAEVS
eukprot:GILK01008446.1.p1 GENE.GILK01008446.1~~GILK01008446.1.p1  ORF type:complete len:213 (+),score=18.92 GILK01008446.1:71-709(+)